MGGVGPTNDRFAAGLGTVSETAWQACITGIEPGKGIYGQDHRSWTSFLTGKGHIAYVLAELLDTKPAKVGVVFRYTLKAERRVS